MYLKIHVRFLGEKARAISLTYPTETDTYSSEERKQEQSLLTYPTLPKSTVFDHQNKVSDIYLENKEALVETYLESKGLKDNGVYHNDEQFFKSR